MSYAVLHIIKANSSLNSIAKHIERTAHPENADPTRTHLNRYNLVGYPDGITGLAAAVEHRIANAGITRKISDRQVRCLNLVMTSDNEGMQKIIDSGKLNEWIADNIKWARDTFGGDNVVGAALHMDERTPHLHIAVVPVVTTERKKKAREATAKKRYRTKAANRPRLCADDIMERGKMSRYQDIYAEAMAKYGLERGIRGSEARHIGQHEYYRQCQLRKKSLEQDVASLSTEKKQLDAETQSLENRKKELERGNRWVEKTITETKAVNKQLTEENAQLAKDKKLLVEYNSTLKETVVGMIEEYKGLETSKDKLSKEMLALEASKMSVAYDSEYAEYKADIMKYFPDVPDLLIWARYCKHIGFPDSLTQRIIAQQPVPFQGALYSPEHSQRFKTEHSEAKLERDPKEKHRFMLTIDGVNVFQWFRDKAKELLAKIGIKPKEPTKGFSRGI